MLKNIALGLCTLALAACAPSAASIGTAIAQTQAAWTAIPSQTALPTLTPNPTSTPYPTLTANPTYTPLPTLTPANTVAVTEIVIQVVTSVPTETPTTQPTPVFTAAPLPSLTPPGPTDTPQPPPPTADALRAPRADGNYLVNADIAPGHWRNDGSATTSDDCYWERLDSTGGIIDNYIGAGNGVMFVAASDYQVHMERCGTWTYLGP